MPTKIFVGNLSSDTTGEDLRPYFEQYGSVTECDVLRNFGFVHMALEEEAEQAITELSGTVIKGQRINVEKSIGRGAMGSGGPRGGRGGPGGKMMGRGGGRGFGPRPPMGGRDRDPYDPYPPPPRGHPYGRDPYPYDYYDRHYPPERLPPARHPDDRRPSPYDREERLPPPRDPYDRYGPPRYPPRSDPYASYDRFAPPPPRAPPSSDPYERPTADYYNRGAYRHLRLKHARPEGAPPPAPAGPQRAANGYDDRRPDPPPPGAGPVESFSSSYTSYYDRFYSKAPANGTSGPAPRGGASQGAGRGMAASRGGGSMAASQRNDQQAALQTGPIYF